MFCRKTKFKNHKLDVNIYLKIVKFTTWNTLRNLIMLNNFCLIIYGHSLLYL